jgi:hypothetical protein
MFQSWEYTKYIPGINGYEITIIDSDFTETVHCDTVWTAIFIIYERRNLPVSTNLIKALIYCSKKLNTPITELGGYKYKIKYSKYKKDIDKYLMLI